MMTQGAIASMVPNTPQFQVIRFQASLEAPWHEPPAAAVCGVPFATLNFSKAMSASYCSGMHCNTTPLTVPKQGRSWRITSRSKTSKKAIAGRGSAWGTSDPGRADVIRYIMVFRHSQHTILDESQNAIDVIVVITTCKVWTNDMTVVGNVIHVNNTNLALFCCCFCFKICNIRSINGLQKHKRSLTINPNLQGD